jgi:hypothetical protein
VTGYSSSIASVKRFAALPRSDQRLVLEATLWLVDVACGLRILPFAALRTLLDRLSRSGHTSGVLVSDRTNL